MKTTIQLRRACLTFVATGVIVWLFRYFHWSMNTAADVGDNRGPLIGQVASTGNGRSRTNVGNKRRDPERHRLVAVPEALLSMYAPLNPIMVEPKKGIASINPRIAALFGVDKEGQSRINKAINESYHANLALRIKNRSVITQTDEQVKMVVKAYPVEGAALRVAIFDALASNSRKEFHRSLWLTLEKGLNDVTRGFGSEDVSYSLTRKNDMWEVHENSTRFNLIYETNGAAEPYPGLRGLFELATLDEPPKR